LKLKQLPGLKKRSSKKTMSGLPSFFQQRGKTVLDELADYELGGELDEEDDRNSAIDDAAFTDGYSGSDLELPSFFQPNTRDNNDSSLTIDSSSDSRFASSSDDVNLSNLLNNFSWPNKGDVFYEEHSFHCFVFHSLCTNFFRNSDAFTDGTHKSEQSLDSDAETAGLIGRLQSVGLQGSSSATPTAIPGAAPLMRPPHEYYEMLARSSGTPLDMPPSIPFPSNRPPQYSQMGGPMGVPTPPMGFTQQHLPMGPPHFIGPGGQMPAPGNNFPPGYSPGLFNNLPTRPPEGNANRGPPSADPRLHFVPGAQRPPPPQHPHPNSLPLDPSLQPFQIGQQFPPGQPLPPFMQPNMPLPMPGPPLMHMQMRPDLIRMGPGGPQGGPQGGRGPGPAQVFQQMAVTTAGAESTGKTGYPKSEMMTSSDVRFVVTKVVQPLETNDPYSDDYYFLQVSAASHGVLALNVVQHYVSGWVQLLTASHTPLMNTSFLLHRVTD
jgi:hypothetical protein